MVKGKITENKAPISASIIVAISDRDNNKFGDYTSNNSGSYLITLPSGKEFKLTYKYKDYPYKTLSINTTNLEGFEEKLFDVNFDLSESLAIVEPKKDSIISPILIPEPIKPVLEPTKTVKPEVVKINSNKTLQQKTIDYGDKYGDISVAGLIFRVQIAAYRYPKNYIYDYLKGLGKIENLLLKDGITRITIGGDFDTLKKALDHNDKVVKAGQKDAFVTILYNGERIYLEDLEKMGIFLK